MTQPTARLGDVAEFIRGITFKPGDVVPLDADDAVVCMRTKNVQALLDCDDLLAVPSKFVRRKDLYLDEGDILVSSANSWNLVGKCCWVPALPWRAAFGGFISVLRGNHARVDRRYLYWWLASERIQALLRSFGQKTTNISNLNFERCLQLELPLPPLPEQRRIAAILDKADALRIQRREALAQLDRLAQSIFEEMFGGGTHAPVNASDAEFKHPRGWPWVLITEVARLATGHTPDRDRPEYWGGTIPWVSLTDIRELNGGRAYKTGQSITELGVANSSAVVLPPGTVCFSRTASVGFVTVMGSEMATSQDFMNWVPGPAIDSTYLMYALMYSRPQLLALSTGSTHRTIYMRVVERFRTLLPPIDLQTVFAERIAAIDRSRQTQEASLLAMEQAFSALQQHAFQGAL